MSVMFSKHGGGAGLPVTVKGAPHPPTVVRRGQSSVFGYELCKPSPLRTRFPLLHAPTSRPDSAGVAELLLSGPRAEARSPRALPSAGNRPSEVPLARAPDSRCVPSAAWPRAPGSPSAARYPIPRTRLPAQSPLTNPAPQLGAGVPPARVPTRPRAPGSASAAPSPASAPWPRLSVRRPRRTPRARPSARNPQTSPARPARCPQPPPCQEAPRLAPPRVGPAPSAAFKLYKVPLSYLGGLVSLLGLGTHRCPQLESGRGKTWVGKDQGCEAGTAETRPGSTSGQRGAP